MTLLTGRIEFGAVVEYRNDKRHYLHVGWADVAKRTAVCARPDGPEKILNTHWLRLVKPPRRWVPHDRR